MKPKEEPPQIELLEIFYYVDGVLYFNKSTNNRMRIGCIAGNIGSDGYFRVGYNKASYKNHRLIWVMFNGSIPTGFVIDHIDGNKQNNIIENLRLATYSENCINSRKSKTLNGTKGVRNMGNRYPYNPWRAQISKNGKQQCAYFHTKEESDSWYNEMSEMLHGKFKYNNKVIL